MNAITSLGAIVVFCLTLTFSVHAQETQPLNATSTITSDMLGVTNAGILPSNPFYFAKEWQRGFLEFMTVNTVAKNALDLQTTNEKIVELEQLASNGLGTADRTEDILTSYRGLLGNIGSRIPALGSDTAAQQFLSEGIGKIILQEQVIRELMNDPTAASFRQTLEQAQATAEKIAERALANPGAAHSAFRTATNASDGIALRAMLIFQLADMTEQAIQQTASLSTLNVVVSARTGAAQMLEVAFNTKKVTADDIAHLVSQFAESPAAAAGVFAGMREHVSGAELRAEIAAARTALLALPVSDNTSQTEAEQYIAQANAYIQNIRQASMAQLSNFPTAAGLLQKALVDLGQATAALKDGNFGVAIDQAGAARAAAQMAWELLNINTDTIISQINQLKQQYDALVNNAQNLISSNPAINSAFSSLEQQIMDISRHGFTSVREQILTPIQNAFFNLEILRQKVNP